ncbi:FUSC family protein [Arthrobacter sp. zg-Y820]|uniref:FUSC family protein n=1 Tax=unclassified Arthrobacter TaxID=235627 RepID=UPI0025407707|nr:MULTISPECIES: FUSC family protein [unclassified Arthrobacter]MCC9196887.1 FUSC family protein [Arthrobacter sp. zg-Y820]MDK1279751.1 FUSC family protein [Arthrobacter sp. zg.Y820]WIB10993.1 FUSC family protein [Arthrobacter sp. zg-Y820]
MGLFIPLLVLILLGRTDLTLCAIFGSLTGVFGRTEPHWRRLRHQAQSGVLMCLTVVAGVSMSIAGRSDWEMVAAATLVAGGISVAADRLRVRPAGPFTYIFAFTATAAAPFAGSIGEAALAVAGSALTAVLLGVAGRLHARTHTPRTHLPRLERQSAPAPDWAGILVHSGRYVAAVAAAGSLALVLGPGHSYWAMLAACAPIAAADAADAPARAGHFILGTYAGVLLSALLLQPDWSPVQLAILLALLQLGGEIYVIRHYGLAMVFLTPVALLMTGFVSTQPAWDLTVDRAVETTIGALVAVVVIALTTGNGAKWMTRMRLAATR